MPYEQIKRELEILQKYSYKTYVKENIRLLKTNPKKYHKCLQNIIGWNVNIGQQIGLNDKSDLDCS